LQQLLPKVNGQLSALFDQATREDLFAQKNSTKKVIVAAIENDLPLSSMQAALIYYQQLIQKRSSAALVQAQRDYFGAHGVYLKQSAENLTFYPWPK
jgi:6-phosphogluconate dehydrogenase